MKSQKTKSLLDILKSINPNYFSFISGITVSLALNIYVSMLWATKPVSILGVLASCILLIASAFFFVSLSLELQSLRELSLTGSPDFLNERERDAIYNKLISQSSKKLYWNFSLSLITTLTGLTIILFAI